MIIRVEDGTVLDLYSGLSDGTIDQLKLAFENSEFIETDEFVNRGDSWPKPLPIEPSPTPSPVVETQNLSNVIAQLNTLTDQKKQTYLQRWPQASQIDLWPMFSEEIIRLKTSDGDVSPALYPVLAGALSVRMGVSPNDLKPEHITGFAAMIIGAKTAHAIELAKLENSYQATMIDWMTDPNCDIAARFEGHYES
jgi:hypothetical protein